MAHDERRGNYGTAMGSASLVAVLTGGLAVSWVDWFMASSPLARPTW